MIYVNDVLVTEETNQENSVRLLTDYLAAKKLLLINLENTILNNEEVDLLLSERPTILKLTAIPTTQVLLDFKEELQNYIIQVEKYIDDVRELENWDSVMTSFVQVSEALLEFKAVANFMQKELINHEQIQAISEKALSQAEEGNSEYILDLIEYELLPILHQFIDETNEEM